MIGLFKYRTRPMEFPVGDSIQPGEHISYSAYVVDNIISVEISYEASFVFGHIISGQTTNYR